MSCERSVEITERVGGHIRARAISTTLCSRCQTSGRCRMDWLSPQSQVQGFEIPIDAPISLKAGDVVTVVVDESALTRQLVWRYGAALSGLVLGLLLGNSLAPVEWLEAGFGFIGLCLGWFVGHLRAGDLEVRIKQ